MVECLTQWDREQTKKIFIHFDRTYARVLLSIDGYDVDWIVVPEKYPTSNIQVFCEPHLQQSYRKYRANLWKNECVPTLNLRALD